MIYHLSYRKACTDFFSRCVFSAYWRHRTSYLSAFIDCVMVEIPWHLTLSHSATSHKSLFVASLMVKNTAVKCFGSLRVALDVSAEYFWVVVFLSVIVFFPLSLIVHGCEAQRGFILMRLSAILVSFHFTLLLSLLGFISEFNCRVSGTLQGFLPLSSQHFSS